jgi:hypothetical protein
MKPSETSNLKTDKESPTVDVINGIVTSTEPLQVSTYATPFPNPRL